MHAQTLVVLDHPDPHMKLGENIYMDGKLLFAWFILESFSNYYVRRTCLAYRHVLVSKFVTSHAVGDISQILYVRLTMRK